MRGDPDPDGLFTPTVTPTREQRHRRARLSKLHDETEWTKVYERAHDPSFEEFVELKLDVLIQVESGKRAGFYIHFKLPGDTAIVYDDGQRLGRCCRGRRETHHMAGNRASLVSTRAGALAGATSRYRPSSAALRMSMDAVEPGGARAVPARASGGAHRVAVRATPGLPPVPSRG